MSNNDFFANRLAAIEEEKAARAEMNRLNGAIPLLLNSKGDAPSEALRPRDRQLLPSRGGRARHNHAAAGKLRQLWTRKKSRRHVGGIPLGLAVTSRHFPSPWSVEETDACIIVQ